MGAAPGLRTVVITNPDNSSISIPSGFTVEQGGAPELWVDIIGLDKIRIGREQTYYLVYGNRGNVDGLGLTLSVSFPKYLPWELGRGVDLIDMFETSTDTT